jgi:hypothetical protein
MGLFYLKALSFFNKFVNKVPTILGSAKSCEKKKVFNVVEHCNSALLKVDNNPNIVKELQQVLQ